MGENYWDATIEAFDGFITKPKLEGKYLKRPPFLFILHIYIETLKASKGFGKALYSDKELSRAYYDPQKSPDVSKKEIYERKELFFKKLIALVKLKTGLTENIIPKMIITGKETEKTNLFLQKLAEAAKDKQDSRPLCKQVLEHDRWA